MPPKKLLIFIEWFSPGFKAGGPIRSCVNLCIALKHQYDIFVLTTDTDHSSDSPYAGIISDQWLKDSTTGVQIFYANKKQLSFRKLAEQIRRVNPDLIYLNLFFSRHFVIFPLWHFFTGKT